MKKQLLLMMLSALATVTYGQTEYRTFLEEGKVWNYNSNNYFTGSNYNFKLFVQGDTIINGTPCKKVYRDTPDNYQYALYEAGRALYMYNRYSGEEPVLLYDFSVNVGENTGPYDATLTGSDLVEVGPRLFRRFTLTMDEYGYDQTRWVEGIGGQFCLESPYPLTGNTVFFLSCELNGETIFTAEDFDRPAYGGETSLRPVGWPAADSSAAVYTLQGCRLQALPAKGVYIRGGRKVVVK